MGRELRGTCVEQGAGGLQIRDSDGLGDGGQHIGQQPRRLVRPRRILMQACKTGRGPERKKQRALTAREVERGPQIGLDRKSVV